MKNCNTQVFKLSLLFLISIFLLTVFATLYSFMSIGCIPVISEAGTGLRFGNQVADSSIVMRIWDLCVISAVLGFIYFLKIRKDPVVLFIVLVSSMFSIFLGTRFNIAIIVTSALLIYVLFQCNKRHAYVMAFFIILGLILLNNVFLKYRDSSVTQNKIMIDNRLNYVQKVISLTFNEYSQLNFVLNTYDGELKYGSTFLSIPTSFIPAPFLELFGISKQKILDNNAACLLANYLFSTKSRGIRTGIMGEGYFNFGFYGFLPMYVFGWLVGFIQKKINTTDFRDYRYGFHIIFYVLLISALVGQINSIGYSLANYSLVYIFVGIAIRSVKKRGKMT